jgi:hypothetical protein
VFSHHRDNLPQNDPRLLEQVRVTVTRPFSVKGQRVEIGERVELSQADAQGLEAMGRCRIER